MSRAPFTNSIPLLQTATGKFCIPTPRVMSGTYVTTANTASVTSITILDNTISIATVVTAANHNLRTGQFVTISGATLASYNGIFKITVVDLVTFTIAVNKSITSPASGTIIFQLTSSTGVSLGCNAVGTGTLAGTEFQVGDWLYDPANDAVRQVAIIYDSLHWEFTENFPANVSSATVQVAPRGVYRGYSIQNLGAGNGSLLGVTISNTAPSQSWFDEEGLDPICGDATGTTFTIGLQKKSA